ncbi:MAG: bifunctional UDP-N-acetylmuramoyl-tripeptide:D-alanyl-D-alanine ligase/alanine racemase [Sphingobacteriales bacterium 41-5]|nr:MAG: bifunctional UDP-N-acetylmuramoyl-tripeptide:D-alanyl-D-alanine ligase/alanine racemase [Sphingobacteriales bacterium 41-5]
MKYTLQNIAQILSVQIPEADVVIDTFLIDSRKLTSKGTSLFFALTGPRRNGHLFIDELYGKGLRHFVVSQSIDEGRYPGSIFLKVDDTLNALQKIAARHRTQFDINVIGITGSNGKTVVKEWLNQLLQTDNKIIRSPKSYNSQIGVPLSVWQLNKKDELAIFEAGISRPGEMEKLENIIRPTIGILTNIGEAHSEGFENKEQKLQEKLKLFKHTKVFIANGDDELLQKNIHHLNVPFFSWGRNDNNAVKIISIERQNFETILGIQYGETSFRIIIPFTDHASIENALTCCALLLYLKVDPDIIAERMRHLHAVNMRLEFKKGINSCTIINDSYSADINSLSIALDFLQQQAIGQKKTVILSDFVDYSDNDLEFYTRVAQLLQKHQVNRLIGIGEKMQSLLPGILSKKDYVIAFSFFMDTAGFVNYFQSSAFKEEVILVKGARVFEFEKIVSLLEQKVHQTILEINLDAIVHNFKAFQQLLKPETKIMVMVKAFAYGSGGAEVASILQYHKADYLGVAYGDEGVELRKAGITIPIMVLNSEAGAFDAITENNLEPNIFSFEMLDAFQQHLNENGYKTYPVHIEVETGMNRLGFSVSDMGKLGGYLKNSEQIKVVSVFSHLVASEDEAEDEFSLRQFSLLNKAADELKYILQYDFIRHIANSSGIARLPQLQLNMVRLGIGLYGVGAKSAQLQLQPALTLKSTVAQIKHLKKGETVSYNRRGVAAHDSLIATVRIGYADGYSRRFGNGVGKMLVNKKLAPVIGTVCMDMTMIDITNIGDVHEGDEVIIFGEQLPVEELAKSIDTIPYEIMTGISQRVKRVYWSE